MSQGPGQGQQGWWGSQNKHKQVIQNPNTIKFGANHMGVAGPDIITFYDALGVTASREQVLLVNYAVGQRDAAVDRVMNLYDLILNINWEAGHGDPPAEPFPSNPTEYRMRINRALDVYGPKIKVAAIENEETNSGYFDLTGFPQTYLDELQWAVDECHNRGVKVMDGAVHAQNFIVNGNTVTITPGGNNGAIAQLLDAFKVMGLDYVNLHFNTTVTSIINNPGNLKKIVDYMANRAGCPVIIGEYSQHDNNPQITADFLTEIKKTNVEYSIAFTSDGSKGWGNFQKIPWDNNDPLSPIGKAYRDNIIPLP